MTFRKTLKMEQLEEKYGQPIREIVADALTDSTSDEAAAVALGISRYTLIIWRANLGIQTRKIAVPA